MIRYVIGDATQPIRVSYGWQYIVHCCNDVGAWGAGFVLAISKRWWKPEAEYRNWYAGLSVNLYPPFELGEIQVIGVEDGISVVNLIGQNGVGRGKDGKPPIRYDAIERGLISLNEIATRFSDNPSIHCPRLGCGLAGGKWENIEEIINKVIDPNIPVVVYDLPT